MQIPIRLKAVSICAGGLCSLMVLSSAWADNCDKINSNPAWKEGFEQMNAAYKAEDWKAALKHAKELEEICDLSPNLNYTMARIHKNRGDKEKYLYYLQKSTQNTERFAVDKDTLDRMWSEKYIAAHPEADPENIEALELTIREQQSTVTNVTDENASLKDQLRSVQLTAGEAIALQDEANTTHAIEDALLWTSVAVSGAGIVLTAGGAVLVVKNSNNAIEAGSNGPYVNSMYNMGWSLLGSGIGVTVASMVALGYFGYRYRINHQNDNTKKLSLIVSPNYSSLVLTF